MSALIFAQFHLCQVKRNEVFSTFIILGGFFANIWFLKEIHVNLLSKSFMKTFLQPQNSLRRVLHVIFHFLITSQY